MSFLINKMIMLLKRALKVWFHSRKKIAQTFFLFLWLPK